MKKIILTVVILMAFNAKATTVCQGQNNSGESYILKAKNGLYLVSHYGHSRNSYAAAYQVQSCSESRQSIYYSQKCALSKVRDFSTWKDMPKEYTLYINSTNGRIYQSTVSLSLNANLVVEFDVQSECKTIKNQSDLVTKRTYNFKCPVGTELVCGNGICTCSRY